MYEFATCPTRAISSPPKTSLPRVRWSSSGLSSAVQWTPKSAGRPRAARVRDSSDRLQLMLRSLLAFGGFALGGTTAALLGGGNPPQAQPAATAASATTVTAGRIAVPQTSIRQALAEGLIL